MNIDYMDLRNEDDMALSVCESAVNLKTKAVLFVGANSCEFTMKASVCYVFLHEGQYHIYSQVLEKFQNQKQAIKQSLYRAITNLKSIGIKDFSLFLTDENYYAMLSRKSSQDSGDSLYGMRGMVCLIGAQTPIEMNQFIQSLSIAYKSYLPPSGLKLKTTLLSEAARLLLFLKGDGSFEITKTFQSFMRKRSFILKLDRIVE